MGFFDKIKITKLRLKYRPLHFFAVSNHACQFNECTIKLCYEYKTMFRAHLRALC
jgi:hypothetical protein